jgi:hypothetical protein
MLDTVYFQKDKKFSGFFDIPEERYFYCKHLADIYLIIFSTDGGNNVSINS